jgi:hypothetical protein
MSRSEAWDWVIWFLCVVILLLTCAYTGWKLADQRPVAYLIDHQATINDIPLSGPPPHNYEPPPP